MAGNQRHSMFGTFLCSDRTKVVVFCSGIKIEVHDINQIVSYKEKHQTLLIKATSICAVVSRLSKVPFQAQNHVKYYTKKKLHTITEIT